MRCGLPASSRQCGRYPGWSSTYAEVADTSEPPNASPIPHHRSGFDRRAAYDIPCSVAALANADDLNMDDQPKTRLICRRCAARMKLARQCPGSTTDSPRFCCFSASTADMSTWSSGPSPRAKRRRETPADASRPKRELTERPRGGVASLGRSDTARYFCEAFCSPRPWQFHARA